MKRVRKARPSQRCGVIRSRYPCTCQRKAILEVVDYRDVGRPYGRIHATQILKGLARQLGYEVKKEKP